MSNHQCWKGRHELLQAGQGGVVLHTRKRPRSLLAPYPNMYRRDVAAALMHISTTASVPSMYPVDLMVSLFESPNIPQFPLTRPMIFGFYPLPRNLSLPLSGSVPHWLAAMVWSCVNQPKWHIRHLCGLGAWVIGGVGFSISFSTWNIVSARLFGTVSSASGKASHPFRYPQWHQLGRCSNRSQRAKWSDV